MTIKIFIYMFIRSVEGKKNLYAFLMKNTVICWTKLKTEKRLATAEQLIRKNSVCCLENQAIIFTERLYRYA